MKTYKLIPVLFMLICISSCETYQHVKTRINPDGSIERESFAKGDSAFMAGNKDNSPFIFMVDDNWQVVPYDSVLKSTVFGYDVEWNIHAESHFSSFEDYSNTVTPRKHMKPLAKPVETLDKRFRWFYTYYNYRAVCSNLKNMIPYPIDNYLNEMEQRIFFQGDNSVLEGMNGMEQSVYLGGLENEFQSWLTRCEFEITMNAINEELQQAGEKELMKRLSGLNGTLYGNSGYSSHNWQSVNTFIAPTVDKVLGDNTFSTFYARHSTQIESRVQEQTDALEVFTYILDYRLEMPGKITRANTQLRDNDSLVWRLTAYRFLTHDYVLEAESRTCNIWAFVLTGLMLLFGIILIKRQSHR